MSPAVKLFGIFGLTPKYRFGLYGPQSKLSFEARPISPIRMDGSSWAAAHGDRMKPSIAAAASDVRTILKPNLRELMLLYGGYRTFGDYLGVDTFGEPRYEYSQPCERASRKRHRGGN